MPPYFVTLRSRSLGYAPLSRLVWQHTNCVIYRKPIICPFRWEVFLGNFDFRLPFSLKTLDMLDHVAENKVMERQHGSPV